MSETKISVKDRETPGCAAQVRQRGQAVKQAPHHVKFYRELWRYRNPSDEAITEDVVVPIMLAVDVFASVDIADVAVKAAMPQYTRVHAAVGVAPYVVGWSHHRRTTSARDGDARGLAQGARQPRPRRAPTRDHARRDPGHAARLVRRIEHRALARHERRLVHPARRWLGGARVDRAGPVLAVFGLIFLPYLAAAQLLSTERKEAP